MSKLYGKTPKKEGEKDTEDSVDKLSEKMDNLTLDYENMKLSDFVQLQTLGMCFSRSDSAHFDLLASNAIFKALEHLVECT